MTDICKCSQGLKNTGSKTCPTGKRLTKVIYMNRFANDNTENGILLTDIQGATGLDAAYWEARINDTDESKRFFPTETIRSIEDIRADPTTEDFDGIPFVVREGNRTFTGVMIDASPQYKEALDAAKCVDVGVYLVDVAGNLIGRLSADGTKLLPLPVAKGTWYTMFVFATDSSVQRVMLNYTYDNIFNDGELRYVSAGAMGVDLRTINGLFDVNTNVETAANATQVVVDFTLIYGTLDDPIAARGLVASDFAATFDGGAINIVSVTEDPANFGRYTIVYDAQVAAGTLAVTLTKTGFAVTTFSTPLTP